MVRKLQNQNWNQEPELQAQGFQYNIRKLSQPNICEVDV